MPGPFSPGIGDRIEERYELAAQLRGCAVARTFLAVDEFTGQNVALTLFDPACVTATSWGAFVKVIAAATAAKVAGLVLPHTLPAALPDSPHAACDPQIDRGLDRLREQGPVPWQRALTIGERIVEILEAVHARTAVAHHGLTPARILVSARDEVKLLDYGVAEFERTRSDDAEYRAPAWPAPVADVRPDVHSVAVMLFELICEARPQPGQSLRRLVPVPHAVDDLLTRALATDPQLQYADLTSLRSDMRQALGLASLQPTPPPAEAPPPPTAAPPIAAPAPTPIAAPEWSRTQPPRPAARPAELELPPMPASYAPRSESTLELRPEPPLETTLELKPPPRESTLELKPEPPRETTLELKPEPPREATLELKPEPPREATLELKPEPRPEATPAQRPTPATPPADATRAPVRTTSKTGAQRTLQAATAARRPTPAASDPSAASSGTRTRAASPTASATNMKVAVEATPKSASPAASATNVKVAVEATTKPTATTTKPAAPRKSPATSSPSMRVRAVQAAIVDEDGPVDVDRTVIAPRPEAPKKEAPLKRPRINIPDRPPAPATDPNESARAHATPKRPRPDATDKPPEPPAPPAGPPRPPPARPAPPKPPPVVRTVVAPPPPPDGATELIAPPPPDGATELIAPPPRPIATSAPAASSVVAKPGPASPPTRAPPLTLKQGLLYLNLALVALLVLALLISLVV